MNRLLSSELNVIEYRSVANLRADWANEPPRRRQFAYMCADLSVS